MPGGSRYGAVFYLISMHVDRRIRLLVLMFNRCWSNYLGRQPQLPLSSIAVSRFEVFPMEDADTWSPYLDSGFGQAHSQPSRTRAVALQISALCEISSDLLLYFYTPTHLEKPMGRQAELKKLGELHMRLEAWHKKLPKEMEPKEGQLPNVLVMQYVQKRVSKVALTASQHVFPAFVHSPLPSIFEIQTRKLSPSSTCISSEILHARGSHDFEAPPFVQAYVWLWTHLQYRSLYRAFRLHNTSAELT